MKFFEVRVPFFRPLWRRILAVLICAGWAAGEAAMGAWAWAAGAGLAAAYLAWAFFIAFENGPAGREDAE
ncbi:MAG: hypothetical protein QNJ13_07150 [Paracoccaceae bacterium]|nr:hypothetical protein [Paracoccaceae bacterium]